MSIKAIERALLIEDNPADARLLREIFHEAGSGETALVHVESMGEAERHLTEHSVDVILLDLGLPDANGLAALRRVRAAAARVPVVVLTGLDDEAIAAQALQEGAQDYLVKGQIVTDSGQIEMRGLFRAMRYAVERKALEEALFVEKERAEVTLNSIGDAVACTDLAGNLTYLNAVAQKLSGWTLAEGQGRPVAQILRIMSVANHEIIPNPMEIAAERDQTACPPSNSLLIRRDGFEMTIENCVAPIHDREGTVTGAVIVFRDVSATHAMVRQIAHSAEYDYLTGLPNRLLLSDRISQAIAVARQDGRQLAVLFLDLDGFKRINDSLGHSTGDRLLRSVAQCLVDCVRNNDTVSRPGGDEFVILLSEIEQSEDAAIAARRMLAAVAQPHRVDQRNLYVTTSVGLSVYPRDGADAETLIRNADIAMYHAKENGRQGYEFFKPAMNVRALERQSIEESLRSALALKEFALHYQPKVDLKTGAITGAEALLRWTHPVRGPISPEQFIPVAESCGLILPIGAWVLREACMQARAWADAGLPAITVAVNVSALQFGHEKFVEGLSEILRETGLDPQFLQLELTESLLMKHADQAASVLRALREKGVQVAIDDFGTGYSSLSYLRKFPVDALKIDQSFIRQIGVDGEDTPIVTAVIAMGRSLELRVVAEGVETQEELAYLQARQCDEAQGYYFSRPVPPQQFLELLRTNISKGGYDWRIESNAKFQGGNGNLARKARREAGGPIYSSRKMKDVLLNEQANDPNAFLSTALASPNEVRFAVSAVLISMAMFVVAGHFAAIQLSPVPAFIPSYESALIFGDVITTVLLFGQFNVTKSRALFTLATGYLFTACIAAAHMLSFPGLFSPSGLLGGGPQSTVWLYTCWHGGFPLFVMAYAFLKDEGNDDVIGEEENILTRGRPVISIAAAVGAVFLAVWTLTLLITRLDYVSPLLVVSGRFTPIYDVIALFLCLMCIAAAAILWCRGSRKVLDIWLIVVMWAWLFDIALSGILNERRFDLGWYSGRIYGLLAASFLLIVLLIENGKYYSGLVLLSGRLSSANRSLEQLSLQDGLTQIANRRFFDLYLAAQIAVARRHKRTLAIILWDVDAFKEYNDHYGHLAGDDCLKQIASALQSCCRRQGDVAARYGGEEFVLILPDTELAGAAQLAELARDAVAQLRIPHAYSPAGPYVTLSGGVAALDKIHGTAEQLITSADRSLFQAKHLGRNRVVLAQTEASKVGPAWTPEHLLGTAPLKPDAASETQRGSLPSREGDAGGSSSRS